MSKTISKTILKNIASNTHNNIDYIVSNIFDYSVQHIVFILINIDLEIAWDIDQNWLAFCTIYGEIVQIVQTERVTT